MHSEYPLWFPSPPLPFAQSFSWIIWLLLIFVYERVHVCQFNQPNAVTLFLKAENMLLQGWHDALPISAVTHRKVFSQGKLFMWSRDAAYVPSKLGFTTLLLSPISWFGGWGEEGELTQLAQNKCIGGKSNSWTSKAPLFVLFEIINNYLSILEWTASGVETVTGAIWELRDSQPAKTH